MSIDIVFHSKLEAEEVNEFINNLKGERADFFKSDFLIYKARASNLIEKEIAKDYDFNSNCNFYISLNNKDRSYDIRDMIDIVRKLFRDDLLVLFQNETLIK